VCTGHCIVQCPVHRQPRAINPFSYALSGGSPDSYCALSGAPISRFKKKASSPTEPEAPCSPSLPVSSLPLAIPTPPPAISDHRRPPSPSVLRLPRAPLLPSSVSCPVLLPLGSVSRGSLILPVCINSKFFKFLSNQMNPVGGMCSIVPIMYPCRFLAPSGGFSLLIWPFLRNPNISPTTCSVKYPNQPKMLKLNPNFSGTFTTLPAISLPNFTPIRDSRLQFH
jgi:hypothetical protein